MANTYVSLAVPAGTGVGAASDVSGMAPEKYVSVDGGVFDGSILLEGSNDGGATFFPLDVGPFTNNTTRPAVFTEPVQQMRVRRTGSSGVGTPTVAVGALSVTSNVFAAMTVPSSDGVGASVDLTGGGDLAAFAVVGAYTGQLFIETSVDGVNFSPTLLFNDGSGATRAQPVSGVLNKARVRRAGSGPGAAPVVTVGSGILFGGGGGGGGFPGFGGAPPAVQPASAAGVAGTASRSDHAHAQDLTTYTPSVVAMQGTGLVTQTSFVAGVATFGLTAIPAAFPGFGGAPPAVASAGSAGAAGTASRSDHTHAQDLSVVYVPSQVAGQASGVFQQSYAAPNATPSILTVGTGQIPFGLASGLLTATGVLVWAPPTLTITSATTTNRIVLNNVVNTASQNIQFAAAGVTYYNLSGSNLTGGSTQVSISVTPDATSAGDDRYQLFVNAISGAQPQWGVRVNAGGGDMIAGLNSAIGAGAQHGFLWQPNTVGISGGGVPGVPNAPAGFSGSRVATCIDLTAITGRFFLYNYLAPNVGWHYVAANDYTATAARIPFGGATTGTQTDSASLVFSSAVSQNRLTVGAGGANAGAILVQSGSLGIPALPGGVTVGINVTDTTAGGAASIAVDDYYFGQAVIGYSNGAYAPLAVGVHGGSSLSLSYAMDDVGAGTAGAQMDGTSGQFVVGGSIGGGLYAVNVIPNAAGADVFLGNSAVAANAAHGFAYIANLNAAPTGAPNAFGGVGAAVVYDRAHGNLWIRDVVNGAWEPIPTFFVTAGAGAGAALINNAPAGIGSLNAKWWQFRDALGTATYIPYFQ